MKYVEHKELVTLFDAGALKSAEILYFPVGRSYWVQFVGAKNKSLYGYKAQRQTGQLREFKSIDAAMSAISKIGFETAKIHL